MISVWYFLQNDLEEIQLNEVVFGTVKKGDLSIVVEGYGTLQSSKQYLITSYSNATVKEILLFPGDKVSIGSELFILENPLLQQEVDTAGLELTQEGANLRQLILNHKRELINEKSRIAGIDAKYKSTELELMAYQKLGKHHVVSSLNLKKKQYEVIQLKKQLLLYNSSLEQLKLIHHEAIMIQKERVQFKKNRLNIAKKFVSELSVRASSSGVIQKLLIELGQSISAGQQLALIASSADIVAVIQIPQSKAHQIQLGQTVIIDNRQDEINGKVIRIDPTVEDNSVSIEVFLPVIPPKSVRLKQNVDAKIRIEVLENILYIERPVNTKAKMLKSLYKLDSSGRLGQRTKIKFGKEAGRFIQIISGGIVKDVFIISDLAEVKSEKISIIN